MKKIFLILILFLLSNISYSKIPDSYIDNTESVNYDKDTNCIYKNFVKKGNNCFKDGLYKKAIEYYESADAELNDGKLKQYTLYNLGISYFAIGKYKESQTTLERCKSLNFSKLLNYEAEIMQVKFGFDTLYNQWIVISKKNINFHFQDTIGFDVNEWIRNREFAFNTINSFFHAKLPKKIDYFIWTDPKAAESILELEGSFTLPTFSLTHGRLNDEWGHELTHSIYYYTGKIKCVNQLIIEGVAVYFQLSTRDYFSDFKKLTGNDYSIADIWKSPQNYNWRITYPLGANIVKMLINWKGRNKFMRLLKNQTYENAVKIYGNKLVEKINQLKSEMDNL